MFNYLKVMTYFKDFIEDYNTATMPHEKYYNYEAWEMNEYRKEQLNKINKTGVIMHFFFFSTFFYYCFHKTKGKYIE